MTVSRTLGLGLPLDWEGQTLLLSPLTWAMLGRLESMLAADALARVERTWPHSEPAAYQGRLEAVAKLIEAGTYDMDSPAWQKHMRTGLGFTRMVWLMLGRSNPMPTLLEVERLVQLRAADLAVRVRLLNRPAKERPGRKRRGEVPFETLVAVLCAEPCLLSLEQVGNLTPYQTSEVYFHARDKAGNILLPVSCDPELNEESSQAMLDATVAAWQKQGLSDAEINVRWEAMFDRLAGIEPQTNGAS